MSCDRCANLCVEYRIKLPVELSRAVALAHSYVADGTIVEVQNSSVATLGDRPFSEVTANGPWDDVLYHQFRCSNCGELFELVAETYHGSGGAWKPKNTASIRERL